MSKLQEVSEDAMARVSEEEIQEMMSRNWEDEIRSQFSGAVKTWTIRLPYSLIDADLLDPNSGYPKFTITSAEVEEVFRPIVKKIYSLVNRQIEAAVKKEGRAPKVMITFGPCLMFEAPSHALTLGIVCDIGGRLWQFQVSPRVPQATLPWSGDLATKRL